MKVDSIDFSHHEAAFIALGRKAGGKIVKKQDKHKVKKASGVN